MASTLITCDAHKDLAAFMYLGENIGTLPHEQRPSVRVDGYELAYDDGSILHVPDDGPALIDACQCGGGYGPKRKRWGDMPGGFWTSPTFSAPAYVCDVCGYMCECCAACETVGDCFCEGA